MSENNICPRCDHPLNEPPSAPSDVWGNTSLEEVSGAAEVPMPDAPDDQEALLAGITPEVGAAPAETPAEAAAPDREDLATTRLPHATPIFASGQKEPPETHDVSATGVPPEDTGAQETRRAMPESTAPATPEPEEVQEPGAPQGEAESAVESAAAELEEEDSQEPGGPEVGAGLEVAEGEEHEEPSELEAEGEAAPDTVSTEPHLEDAIRPPAEPELDASEMPTGRYESESGEPRPEAGGTVIAQTPPRQAGLSHPAYIVPPAPYTPPPLPTPPPPAWIAPPAPAFIAPVDYGYVSPGEAYLQQRVQAYLRGGYRVHVHGPQEATLSRGKRLGVGGWLLALITVIGLFWYLLILAVGGFQSDKVYIVLESDGRVYEDGPGAAHVRQQRSRAGRRWSMFGLIVFIMSLVLAIILGAVGAVFLTQDRYQAALREAYPAITLFEEHFSSTQANPDDVSLAKDGAVVYAILAGITLVGLWGGATLLVVGTIHASAYHTRVPPLPALA
jgi:hypothetical protein